MLMDVIWDVCFLFYIFYLRWIWSLTAFQSNLNKNVIITGMTRSGKKWMNEWKVIKHKRLGENERVREREKERKRDNPIIKRAEGKYRQWIGWFRLLCHFSACSCIYLLNQCMLFAQQNKCNIEACIITTNKFIDFYNFGEKRNIFIWFFWFNIFIILPIQ